MAPHKGIQLKPRDIENLGEVKHMLSTHIEQWEVDILARGRREGIEKGIEKGETALLAKMLELKYGSLPDGVRDKLAQADAAAIEQWAAKLLAAQTLAEIFD